MHPRKQVSETGEAIDGPGQNDADDARAEKHGREHEDAGQLRKRLASEKVWCGHEQSANPGDRKRQRKIAADGTAAEEGIALHGTRLLLHARRVASFVVDGRSAGRMSIRSP